MGPLQGIRVLEAGGIGAVPFCGMLFADLGAEVVQVCRPGALPSPTDVPGRGRHQLVLDLRSEAGRDAALELAAGADILIEGFRPGVMERLGLGPESCMAHSPRLVYGRMTGWGQDGPLAQVAGHDLNYLALSGALHAMGDDGEPPPVPLNLVADYGGGAMLLAFGVLAALQERGVSGLGQIVDAAMAEGSALLASLFYGMRASGRWRPGRGVNHLDGGAHFYNSYACADGRFLAVAATEPQFYAALLKLLEIDDPAFNEQWDRARWPHLRQRLASVFLARTRDAWCLLAEGHDVCISPVLDWDEAPRHPQHVARAAFATLDGVVQPAAGPRFSRTPPAPLRAAQPAAMDLLLGWGVQTRTLAALRRGEA